MSCKSVTTSYVTASRITRYVFCEGYDLKNKYTNVQIETGLECSNNSESRPYPSDLLASMTSLPVQWRATSTCCKYIDSTSTTYFTPCGQSVPNENYLYTLIYPQYMYNYAQFVSTNWQLDMRLKIKDEALNLGASIAEYRETSKMFYDMALGVRNAIKVARGKSRRKHKFTTCDIADVNILNSFGIQPLVSDFVDSFQILQDRLERPLKRRFVVTKVAEGSKMRVACNYGAAQLNGGINRSDRAIVYVTFKNPKSMTMGNPLELMWELTPYSFVIDWMIPVGDYLSSLDALTDVQSMSGTLTSKFTYNGGFKNPDKETLEDGTLDFSAHIRTILTTIPFPDLPKYEPSKSLKAVANGLSLLHQTSDHCKKWKRRL